MQWDSRPFILLRCLAAGACIAFAMPPWGWWPFVFVGIALWDRLLANTSWKQRFRRTWLVGCTWFFPTLLWMYDLTPPGYVMASISYAAYFGVACALIPPTRWRWIALPGAIVIAEYVKAFYPFGGVPLANLSLTQAGSCGPPCTQIDSPLAQGARFLGPYFVIVLVVVLGIALSAAWERRWQAAGIAAAVVVVGTGVGYVAPSGHDVGTVRIAIVQGGGPQRTRTSATDRVDVFTRHVKATREQVHTPVDIILWPENVITVEGKLQDNPEYPELQKLAREYDATMIVGATEGVDKKSFLNASIVINPDGTIGERFDKVRTVPFGEFVPLRPIIEAIAGDSGIPGRDAVPGDGHGVLHTQQGQFGVVISWEVYFAGRARDAIGSGGEILMNPTNGASYWLTQVQTQQIASSRLRAIETGRWVTQAAPTGFSALIAPNGALLDRTNVSEARVIEADVPRREGQTISTLVGPWPVLALSFAAIAVAWYLARRDPTDPATSAREIDRGREVDGFEEATVV